MADDHSQPVEQPKPTGSAASEETNWGEDWESAFQAEDDTFFSDEKDAGFFLDENEPPVTVGDTAQGLNSLSEKNLFGMPDPGVVPAVNPGKSIFSVAALTAFFLSTKITAQALFTRFQSFPIFIRIPLYVLPFLLFGILFVLLGTSTPPATKLKADAPPTPLKNAAPDSYGNGSQLHPGKVRKKWAFPAFIIPINNQASAQPVTFVLVDITLIATLDEQELPPAEKKVFVRDIIYQFFQNKSLEDLRRFSLARGEMNKELRAWLLKQWPEAPVESIIFHKYQLS